MTPQEAIAWLVFNPDEGAIPVENKRSGVRYWVNADVIELQCTATLGGELVATGEDLVYGWRIGHLRTQRGRMLPSVQWFRLRSVKLLPVSEWETI